MPEKSRHTRGNAKSPGSGGASPYLPGRANERRYADTLPSSLQAQVCQAGMIQWARERSIPMKFAFGFFDRQIVNGSVPMMH